MDTRKLWTATLASIAAGILIFSGLGSVSPANGAMLFDASLKDGNYGTGWAVPVLPLFTVPDPSPPGIVDGTEGVTFISTETDGRSNALINWAILATDRISFRTHGTVSFFFRADRETHISGEILGDNYGFTAFRNGQSTISASANRLDNDPGPEDDQVQISWKTCDGSFWYWHGPVTLEYDRWYHLGFAWGGPENPHETWVCGALGAEDSVGTIPWGVSSGTGSATNFGLGDNHERAVDPYGSAAGVTFADIRVWDEYRLQGGTELCEVVELPVAVDIKPTSCPNPLNRKSKGVVPVAILGTEDFDVTTIDPLTIRLSLDGDRDGGVAPLRSDLEDVAEPLIDGDECECHDSGPDGFMDLTLKFSTQDLVGLNLGLSAVGDVVPLILTGSLRESAGGTAIIGQDCVLIVK
jgi:hypothetical protein